MEKSCRKCAPKAIPDPFLILLNNSEQPLHARISFKNEIFWKRIFKKPLKSYFYLFFRTQSLLIGKLIKRGLELMTSCFQVMKQVQKYSFICYILSSQVWWRNAEQFLSYPKNYIWKFMEVNSWHKLFHFYLSFRIWKVWKGREKITKIWITQEQKELFRWNKKHFS